MLNKLPAFMSLLILLSSALSADFTDSHMVLHPRLPGSDPFILEISGIWPTDCHPGEQKPVVKSYDGSRLVIDFEIVVVHITCNTKDTAYRVLVDMSEAVRTTKPSGDGLEVNVSFQGADFEQTFELVCPADNDCSAFAGKQQLPERGLYITPGRASEGLLVARQNNTTAIFPLVYDEAGRSEWLFSIAHAVEDSIFASMSRWSGGDCFDCEPTDSQAEMTVIGYLSVLVERPGMLLVKVNDRPFAPYQKLVYGYSNFQLEQAGNPPLVGLEGRWGLSENRGTSPPLGDLSEFFPGAFDIKLDVLVPADDGTSAIGQVSYLVTTITGEAFGQLVCKGQTSLDESRNVCEFIDPSDADVEEPLFLFTQDGPASLSIEFGRSLIAVGIAPGGKAVRLD